MIGSQFCFELKKVAAGKLEASVNEVLLRSTSFNVVKLPPFFICPDFSEDVATLCIALQRLHT